MLGLSFASVPLYDLFCRVTGYAGTTQKASLAPGPKVDGSLYKVRFDANISPDLNWAFVAPSEEIELKPGVEKIIYYTAKNLSNEPSTGTASFNVSPPKAGSVFMKIECFCFINQKLMPNEEIKMPVSFYIDPEIDNDDNLKSLNEITLSYTFFKVE
jgi:cytochrome c oxidase assembly protein subunit 11